MFNEGGFDVVQPVYGYSDRQQSHSLQGFNKVIGEIPLQITAEIGRAKLTVSEILKLQVGSVVELDKPSTDPVDVRVNSKLIARGEVVSVDDCYGVRVTNVIGHGSF